MQEVQQNKEEKNNKSKLLILILLLLVIGLCAYIFLGRKSQKPEQTKSMETNQSEYVKPEEPVDRSKNVTLPGWGGFTVPANKKTITQGFEFHNPKENYWYEDYITVEGKKLDEKLVVDSGNQVELNHYLKLAGVNKKVAKVTDYDKDCFKIKKNNAGNYTVEGIKGYKGNKAISMQTTDGKSMDITVDCKSECYYMTFGLYLSKDDELLYQSDLVSPGMYIQKMMMKHALKAGTYEAYVACQPYRSDKKTKTNQGVVKITLTVK